MTSVKGKSVYLSGPMTGMPDWNRDAFMAADDKVEEDANESEAETDVDISGVISADGVPDEDVDDG